MAEQRYQAVLAVIADGRSVVEVAGQWGVSRQPVHAWLARYEAEGLDGLVDRSHRPVSCPYQLVADLEAWVLALRRGRLAGGRGGSGWSCVGWGSTRCLRLRRYADSRVL